MKKMILLISLAALLVLAGCLEKPMDLNEAELIARTSSCMAQGNLTNSSFFNNESQTWWIDLDTVRPGCAPACVVYLSNKTAEVNWRCTGLLPINVSECFKPCHIEIGTDYTANPPTCFADVLACTMEYRAGDACMKYVNCAVKDNGCETTSDPKFSMCISCFEDAAAGKKNATDCETSYQ